MGGRADDTQSFALPKIYRKLYYCVRCVASSARLAISPGSFALWPSGCLSGPGEVRHRGHHVPVALAAKVILKAFACTTIGFMSCCPGGKHIPCPCHIAKGMCMGLDASQESVVACPNR